MGRVTGWYPGLVSLGVLFCRVRYEPRNGLDAVKGTGVCPAAGVASHVRLTHRGSARECVSARGPPYTGMPGAVNTASHVVCF
jgi:hypothetical protein